MNFLGSKFTLSSKVFKFCHQILNSIIEFNHPPFEIKWFSELLLPSWNADPGFYSLQKSTSLPKIWRCRQITGTSVTKWFYGKILLVQRVQAEKFLEIKLYNHTDYTIQLYNSRRFNLKLFFYNQNFEIHNIKNVFSNFSFKPKFLLFEEILRLPE